MKLRKKEKLFSLTQSDFKWEFFIGSGDGGQKKQKTASACRCTHEASGAVGISQDSRKQSENKKLAFKRMSESIEFQNWMKLQKEIAFGKIKYEEADINGEFVEKPLSPGKY